MFRTLVKTEALAVANQTVAVRQGERPALASSRRVTTAGGKKSTQRTARTGGAGCRPSVFRVP